MNRINIIEAFDRLTESLEDFNTFWVSNAVCGQVWKLPLSPDGKALTRINPEPVHGDEALALAADAVRRLHRLPEQFPTTVFRLPGWVAVNADLRATVDTINAAKQHLRAVMRKIDQRRRAEIAAATLPGVSLLQAYRKIDFFDQTPVRLLWSWAGHTTAHRRIRAGEVAKSIEDARRHRVTGMPPEEWQANLDRELQVLSAFVPSTPLLYRRTIAPHPRVMVYLQPGPRYAAMLHANLPLFFRAEKDKKLPDIDPLGPYDHDVRQKPRRDRRRLIPLIERLDLYFPIKTR